MLDKDQLPVVKLSIEQSYGHVLRRTLAIGVFKGIEEIRSTMKIHSKRKLTSQEQMSIFNEQINTDRAKEMLKFGVDRMINHRHDIIDAMLLEYGLHLTSDELIFYHDVMEKIVLKWGEVIKNHIHYGRYGTIGAMLPHPKDD